jgi:putative DNA primase/helicase
MVDALTDVGCEPRRSGDGYAARCPAHDDRNPSLSVGEGTDGEVLIHCHAGCSVEDIVAAVKLELVDLFPAKADDTRPSIAATYDYDDEDGILLFQVVRMFPKRFWQRRPDGNGDWVKGLGQTRRVLYRLREVLEAVADRRTIFVVEGEKDVDALVAVGEVATCNPMGAGKWRREHAEALSGAADIVIVADADESGRKHARQVAASLDGQVGRVRIVEAAHGKDAAEHLGAGLTVEDFKVVYDSEWDGGIRRAHVIPLIGVKRERVRWLWPGRLPEGKLVVLDGDPDVGKSVICLDLAARLTTASPMPDGYQPDHKCGVLVMTAEDGTADTVVPRLEAAEADMNRCFSFVAVTTVDEEGKLVEREPVLPLDADLLETKIIEHEVGLVIVDVLVAYLPSQTDTYRDQDIRRALRPLVGVAQRTGACIVCIRHLNKTPGGSAIYRGGGSIGIIAGVRVGLLAGHDPDDPGLRVLAVQKGNLRVKPDSLAYRIIEDETRECAKIAWEGVSERHADELVVAPRTPEERTALDEACQFLRSLLGDGDVDANVVMSSARKAAVSDMTLRRAKAQMHVESVKIGKPGDKSQRWVWRLPLPKVVTPPVLEHASAFGNDDHLRGSGTPNPPKVITKSKGNDHLPEQDDHLRASRAEQPPKMITDPEDDRMFRYREPDHLPDLPEPSPLSQRPNQDDEMGQRDSGESPPEGPY